MSWLPCMSRAEVERIVGDGLPVTSDTVRQVRARGVSDDDIVWAACRALDASTRTAWLERVVTRAVTTHALHCGVPAIESWARRWLGGEDRTAESARAAARAARAATAAWAAPAAWAADAAAWAAVAATRAADAAADAATRAAEAAWYAARAAEASSHAALAAWADAVEWSRQVEDLCEVLGVRDMTPAGLRAIRAELGLTQAQMGELIGVSKTAIYMMEAGRRAITRRTAMQVEALRK